MKQRIRGRLRRLLDDSGVEWDAVSGRRHIKIVVAGRLAGVVSVKGNHDRGDVGDRFVIGRVRAAIEAARGDR